MSQVNTIYLIDDDQLSNHLNKLVIRKMDINMDIKAFDQPLSALNTLQEITTDNYSSFPEIILLDVNMPVMDAWNFLDEYEKLPVSVLSKCKVFIVSSSIDTQDIVKSKDYKSVNGFISKPLNTEKIYKILLPDQE